jgi:hypothetical protein
MAEQRAASPGTAAGLLIRYSLSILSRPLIISMIFSVSVSFPRPVCTYSYLQLGMAYAFSGQPDKAIESFRKTVSWARKVSPSTFNLSCLVLCLVSLCFAL